jgi:dipeptidyl aminopeptidase/acylaminoacyl peptidase
LIPRDLLFGNPERMSPQISPDGRYLAYLAPDERNVLQVWLQTLGEAGESGEAFLPATGGAGSGGPRMLTADKKRGIRVFFWTYEPDQLVYWQDVDGDEEWHLYAVNLRTQIVRDLTPFQGIQARPVAVDPNVPGEMLVAMNLEDRTRHDVYRVDLKTGAITSDTRNPGNVASWTADAQLAVRAATAITSDGGFDLLVRDTPEGDWRVVRHWEPEDEGAAVAFSADGRTLFVSGSHDANAQRLLALDLATGTETVIAEDPQYDLGGVFLHPVRRTVQAVAFHREKLDWQVIDPEIAEDFAALTALEKGVFSVISRDLEDRTWVVSTVRDDRPVEYFVYDRPTRCATFLFSQQPKLDNVTLAPMEPISYTARDGLTIHGYLTTPVGIPAQNLPTVLLVHGGPWARDTWGLNPHPQWLANRGYAVLQVNFRGSAGYGKQFLHAGDREWAGKMHDDLIDGVNWIVGRGIADPKKIAIMGGSYGGYATLVGLTFTPEVFAAGVDIVGPSNLITLIRTIPPYWEPMKALFKKRVGDVETEEEFLKSRSPVFFADRIRAPLLVAQGANDPRVKQAESEQIVAAMRQAGLPVEYVLYTDEGHGFARPENRLHFYARAEAFLARHLGGRCDSQGTRAATGPRRRKSENTGHSGVVR